MAKTIYENNEVIIELENHDTHEAKININGKNLIWISREFEDEFIQKLRDVFDNYRI